KRATKTFYMSEKSLLNMRFCYKSVLTLSLRFGTIIVRDAMESAFLKARMQSRSHSFYYSFPHLPNASTFLPNRKVRKRCSLAGGSRERLCFYRGVNKTAKAFYPHLPPHYTRRVSCL